MCSVTYLQTEVRDCQLSQCEFPQHPRAHLRGCAWEANVSAHVLKPFVDQGGEVSRNRPSFHPLRCFLGRHSCGLRNSAAPASGVQCGEALAHPRRPSECSPCQKPALSPVAVPLCAHSLCTSPSGQASLRLWDWHTEAESSSWDMEAS